MNRHEQPQCFRSELRTYLIAAFALTILLGLSGISNAQSQWTTNGNNINNTNSGSVGIGTTDPSLGGAVSAKFTIVTPDDSSTALATGNGTFPRFALNNHSNGSWTMYDYAGNAWHPGITQLSGNVGIGTTNPQSNLQIGTQTGLSTPNPITLSLGGTFSNSAGANLKLKLYDDGVNIYGIGVSSSSLDFGVNSTGSYNFYAAGGHRMRIDTSASASTLWLKSSTTTNQATLAASDSNGASGNFAALWSGWSGGTPNTPAILWNNGQDLRIGGGVTNISTGAGFTEFIRVKSGTGNVGIGTTGPSHKLDVQGGQINASGGLCIAGDCRSSWSQVGGGGGSSQWTTSGSSIYYNSGNVGIGTAAPDSSLHLAGGSLSAYPKPGQASWASAIFSNNYDATIRLLHSGGVSTLYTDSSLQAVNFSTNGSANSRLFISGGGNIGIGTTSPANKLTVTGDGSGIAQIGSIGCGSNYNYVGITLSLTAAPGGCSNYTFASSPTDQTLYINRPSGNSIRFRENNDYSPDQLVIASGGNVGIGTTTPTAKLDVNGDINVTGNINAKYQDIAEWVTASQELPAGTVVVVDSQKSNQVLPSSQSYDTRVAGVISAKPGIALGEAGPNKVLVATTGRVRVKVDATLAPVHIGDLLVTSDKAGMAMKSEAVTIGGRQFHAPGTLIGKALEPLEKGVGEILVLLSLQ